SCADIKSVDDLGKKFLKELEKFFVNRHELTGKNYRILDVKGPGTTDQIQAGIEFLSGGHLAHFCGSLGDSEEGTARLVISAPVITALRIWPNRSVNVFGVCGIKMVLLWSLAAISFRVSKYWVIRTSCMTSWGVEPSTVFAKSSTDSFTPEMMALRWLAMPSPCRRLDSASASACFTRSNLLVSARDTVASRSRCAALMSFIAAFTFWSGTMSEMSTFTIE